MVAFAAVLACAARAGASLAHVTKGPQSWAHSKLAQAPRDSASNSSLQEECTLSLRTRCKVGRQLRFRVNDVVPQVAHQGAIVIGEELVVGSTSQQGAAWAQRVVVQLPRHVCGNDGGSQQGWAENN